MRKVVAILLFLVCNYAGSEEKYKKGTSTICIEVKWVEMKADYNKWE